MLAAARAVIDQAPGVDLDYLELTSADLGDPQPGDARLLIAARVGKPRLLDNIHLTLPNHAVPILAEPNPTGGN